MKNKRDTQLRLRNAVASIANILYDSQTGIVDYCKLCSILNILRKPTELEIIKWYIKDDNTGQYYPLPIGTIDPIYDAIVSKYVVVVCEENMYEQNPVSFGAGLEPTIILNIVRASASGGGIADIYLSKTALGLITVKAGDVLVTDKFNHYVVTRANVNYVRTRQEAFDNSIQCVQVHPLSNIVEPSYLSINGKRYISPEFNAYCEMDNPLPRMLTIIPYTSILRTDPEQTFMFIDSDILGIS